MGALDSRGNVRVALLGAIIAVHLCHGEQLAALLSNTTAAASTTAPHNTSGTTSAPGTSTTTAAPPTTAAPGVELEFSATIPSIPSTQTTSSRARTSIAGILGVSTADISVSYWSVSSKRARWQFVGTQAEQQQNQLASLTPAQASAQYGFENFRAYRASPPAPPGSPSSSSGSSIVFESVLPLLVIIGAGAVFFWYRRRQQQRRQQMLEMQQGGVAGTPGGLEMPVQQPYGNPQSGYAPMGAPVAGAEGYMGQPAGAPYAGQPQGYGGQPQGYGAPPPQSGVAYGAPPPGGVAYGYPAGQQPAPGY